MSSSTNNVNEDLLELVEEFVTRHRNGESPSVIMIIAMHGNDRNLDIQPLIQLALQGDRGALADLFERHRARLRKMVDLRLDRRIRGRVNPSCKKPMSIWLPRLTVIEPIRRCRFLSGCVG